MGSVHRRLVMIGVLAAVMIPVAAMAQSIRFRDVTKEAGLYEFIKQPRSALFRNLDNLKFEDVTQKSGLVRFVERLGFNINSRCVWSNSQSVFIKNQCVCR